MIKAYARLKETAASSLDTQALALLKAVHEWVQERGNSDLYDYEKLFEKLLADTGKQVQNLLKKQKYKLYAWDTDISNSLIFGEAKLTSNGEDLITIYLGIEGSPKGKLDILITYGKKEIRKFCTAVKPQADLISSTLTKFYRENF